MLITLQVSLSVKALKITPKKYLGMFIFLENKHEGKCSKRQQFPLSALSSTK